MINSIRGFESKAASLDACKFKSANPSLSSKTADLIKRIFQTRVTVGNIDLNPINYLNDTPNIDDINSIYSENELSEFNLSKNDLNKNNFSSQLKDERCNKLAKNAATYHFSWFLFEVVCGMDPSKELKSIVPVYLKIVKETNSKNELFDNYLLVFLKNLGERLSFFQKIKVIFVYLILSDVLEVTINELLINTTNSIIRKYSNRKELLYALRSIIKRLNTFFSDYQNVAIRYVNSRNLATIDNTLEGNFDDFLAREMKTRSFLRTEEHKGYSEEELRNEFAKIFCELIPKVSLAKTRLTKIGLRRWKAHFPSQFMLKLILQVPYGILQIFLIVPCLVIDAILNIYIKNKLVGINLFGFRRPGVIQQVIQILTEKGWDDSYRKTFDILVYNQLNKLAKSSNGFSTDTSTRSTIDEQTKEHIHSLVQSLITALDINSAKAQGWKKIQSIIDESSPSTIDKSVRLGMEMSIEEGIIKLCDFLTQDNTLNCLIEDFLNALNSLYEGKNTSFNTSTRSKVVALTKKIIHQSVRDSLRSTLGNATKIAKKEGQKFYERLKVYYAPKLTAIRLEIEYLISNDLVTEDSIHSATSKLLNFRQQLFDEEFYNFQRQYFDTFKTLSNEMPQELKPIAQLLNSSFKYLKLSSKLFSERKILNLALKKLNELASSKNNFEIRFNEIKKNLKKDSIYKLELLIKKKNESKDKVDQLSEKLKYIKNSLNINSYFSEVNFLFFLKKHNLNSTYLSERIRKKVLNGFKNYTPIFENALNDLIDSTTEDLKEYQAKLHIINSAILAERHKEITNLSNLESKLQNLLKKEIKEMEDQQSKIKKNYTDQLKNVAKSIFSAENKILRLKTKNVVNKNNFFFFTAMSYLGITNQLYSIMKINTLVDIFKKYSINGSTLQFFNAEPLKRLTKKIQEFTFDYSLADNLKGITNKVPETISSIFFKELPLSSFFYQSIKAYILSKGLGKIGDGLINCIADYFITPKVVKRARSAFSFIDQTFKGLINSSLLLNIELIQGNK